MKEGEFVIRFHCKNCGQKIRVPEIHAGKKSKCPKCKNMVVIPKAEGASLPASQSDSAKSEISSKYSDFDLTFLDVPQKDKDPIQPTSQYDVSDKAFGGVQEPEEGPGTEETEYVDERKLPWLIDVILYPASLHGMIQIGIFLFLSFLIGLLSRFVLSRLGPYAGILSLVLRVPLIGYIAFYFGYCIFDSSKGGRRAPDIRAEHILDKEDFILQLFLMLGCVAVCFCPVAIYYGFIQRIDSTFWLLSACGIFFFPMALLAGVLFDAIHALNPIFIIGSISRTFFTYCGLILSFCLFGGLVAVMVRIIHRLPILGFISNAVNLYLLFVAAHLLGWFYWWNKDKLDWGI